MSGRALSAATSAVACYKRDATLPFLFGLGASWGGFESLVTAANMQRARSITDWSARGPVVRLHIGLEDPADLIADLGRGFEALQRND